MDKRITDELQKLGREAAREDKKRAAVFEGLVKSEGWKLFVELVNRHLESLGADLIQPATGIESILKNEFHKGQMYGMILLRDLPPTVIEAIRPTATNEE